MVNASSEVCVTCESGLLTVTLNRPTRMNAITPTMLDTLEEIFTARAHEDDISTVVLTGSGSAFCSGADLKNSEPTSSRDASRLMDVTNSIVRGIVNCPRPVIAAVNGPAVGFGVALAAAADLAVASTSAYFLLAFTKVGLMPDGGATALVGAAIGRARAMRMLLLAQRVSAAEAAALGLIAEVVDDDGFPRRIEELAASLSKAPQAALARTKEAVNAAMLPELDAALKRESEGQVGLLGSEAFAAAMASFTARSSH